MTSGYAIVTLVVFIISILFVIRPVFIPTPRPIPRIPLNLTTAPILAIALLWAAQCIDPVVIRNGIVGTEGVRPYNVLVLFFSLAYMAITLDITGIHRSVAFWVSNMGGCNGWKSYLYFYILLTLLSILLGNDPAIRSGTLFLVYYTQVEALAPRAWFMAEFAAANTASMVLFVGNPTNVIICEGFNVNNATFTLYTILPFLACNIFCFVALAFQYRNQVPRKLRRTAPFDPRSALLDPIGAWVGSFILGITLILCLVTSFLGIDAWMISLGLAVAKFLLDLQWDRYRHSRGIPIFVRGLRRPVEEGIDEGSVVEDNPPSPSDVKRSPFSLKSFPLRGIPVLVHGLRKPVGERIDECSVVKNNQHTEIEPSHHAPPGDIERTSFSFVRSFPPGEEVTIWPPPETRKIERLPKPVGEGISEASVVEDNQHTEDEPSCHRLHSDVEQSSYSFVRSFPLEQEVGVCPSETCEIGGSPRLVKEGIDKGSVVDNNQQAEGELSRHPSPTHHMERSTSFPLEDSSSYQRSLTDLKRSLSFITDEGTSVSSQLGTLESDLRTRQPSSPLPVSRRYLSCMDGLFRQLEKHFPTFVTALPRLPFALVPFAFSQFILVEALDHQGWVEVFARWLKRACHDQIHPTIWLVGVLGVILCNLSGTNIGATILLTKVVRAAALPYDANRAAAIALAVASNIGAVSFTFSASLGGLLWRSILLQKGIYVRQRDFAFWNLLPLLVMTTMGLGTVSAEMAVLFQS